MMNSTENKSNILILEPIGIDSWSRPVYKDPSGHLWKDVTLGSCNPQLYSALDDDFDGEPDEPIGQKFIIMPFCEKPKPEPAVLISSVTGEYKD